MKKRGDVVFSVEIITEGDEMRLEGEAVRLKSRGRDPVTLLSSLGLQFQLQLRHNHHTHDNIERKD